MGRECRIRLTLADHRADRLPEVLKATKEWLYLVPFALCREDLARLRAGADLASAPGAG
ncbi:MAG TPA: hypothetical protein VNF73_09540 [Candidatus Saccharimonadales bacterium]|nr:hypothetical protein [Candidatus Saccharimonadales bacterium]